MMALAFLQGLVFGYVVGRLCQAHVPTTSSSYRGQLVSERPPPPPKPPKAPV